jgi:endonuclease/exonuclease/phosphatase family metal-dependent hydrolase
MKCVSYNIQYGLGSDGQYDLARIAGEIASADIIALQEVDRFWKRSGLVDSPAVLASHMPDHHWVYGPNLDMDASYEEQGRIVHRRKQFGTMILSRWPILSSRNHLLPKWGDRVHHSIQQGMLEAVVCTPLGPVRFYSVHLSHLTEATRMPQIAAIKAILARAPSEGGAWCGGHPNAASGWIEEAEPPMPSSFIVMGDFNCGPSSREYAALVGDVAAGYGRLTNRTGLLDAWVLAGHDEDSGKTHPNASQRIDHVFISADLDNTVVDAWADDSALGSDHWPVWVVLEAKNDGS